MKVTVTKVDDANIIVSGTLDSKAIEQSVEKLAKQAAKEIKVDGFRAGKVPVSVVKQMHGDKLAQDAEGEVLRELIDVGIKEAAINVADMIGEPSFKKYEKKDTGIEVEVEVSTKPVFDLDGHKDVVPKFDKPKVDVKEVEKRLQELADTNAPYTKLAKKRMVRDGDMTVIDFEGSIDGVPFDGGKAEKFRLEIGSKQFIGGFEEQIVGMKYEEEKEITVTFPEQYQAAELAGKEAVFKVKLHEIEEKKAGKVSDELAQALLQDGLVDF